MTVLFWIFLGYLAGSFPTGYIVVKLVKEIDIRTVGSGNIGATNVGRLMGKKWAIAVAIADMLKGAIGVLCAQTVGVVEPWTIALAGFAGVCGHNFPIWLGFKGGKGVSSTYGVIFFLYPPLSFLLAPAGGVIWLILFKVKGYVSLASLVSLWCLPFLALGLFFPFPYIAVITGLAVFSTIRHRDNIRRLAEGKESRFGEKTKKNRN